MQAAKRLVELGIRFYGPQAPELFKASYVEPDKYDHVVIGTGESRAVAAARAVSHMRDLGVQNIKEAIEEHVQVVLTPDCTEIEAGDSELNMYCVIGIRVER
jgi:hypothetical protein